MASKKQLVAELAKLDEREWHDLIESAWKERQKQESEETEDELERATTNEELAQRHARTFLRSDPGVSRVFYFPSQKSSRDVRLLVVNVLLIVPENAPIEAVPYGVNPGVGQEHNLLVIDATPGQWQSVQRGELKLPRGWDLTTAKELSVRRRLTR